MIKRKKNNEVFNKLNHLYLNICQILFIFVIMIFNFIKLFKYHITTYLNFNFFIILIKLAINQVLIQENELILNLKNFF